MNDYNWEQNVQSMCKKNSCGWPINYVKYKHTSLNNDDDDDDQQVCHQHYHHYRDQTSEEQGQENEIDIPSKHRKYMNHPYRHGLVIHENFDEIYPDAIEPEIKVNKVNKTLNL